MATCMMTGHRLREPDSRARYVLSSRNGAPHGHARSATLRHTCHGCPRLLPPTTTQGTGNKVTPTITRAQPRSHGPVSPSAALQVRWQDCQDIVPTAKRASTPSLQCVECGLPVFRNTAELALACCASCARTSPRLLWGGLIAHLQLARRGLMLSTRRRPGGGCHCRPSRSP